MKFIFWVLVNNFNMYQPFVSYVDFWSAIKSRDKFADPEGVFIANLLIFTISKSASEAILMYETSKHHMMLMTTAVHSWL